MKQDNRTEQEKITSIHQSVDRAPNDGFLVLIHPNAYMEQDKMKKPIALAVAGLAALTLAGCSSDADVASENLSKQADNFEIARRIVFFNGITDKYLLEIQGYCSINPDTGSKKLDVTCKTNDGMRKHFLGLSDNVSYFVEQVQGANVSTDFYEVNFKPQAILPDIELR
jgi:hypothetical protein